MLVNTHFSWDMSESEKEKYKKNNPLFKTSDRGLQRRTYLYVLKQRVANEDGEEHCDGYSCEAGYKYIRDDILGLTWIGVIAYAIYKLIKRYR